MSWSLVRPWQVWEQRVLVHLSDKTTTFYNLSYLREVGLNCLTGKTGTESLDDRMSHKWKNTYTRRVWLLVRPVCVDVPPKWRQHRLLSSQPLKQGVTAALPVQLHFIELQPTTGTTKQCKQSKSRKVCGDEGNLWPCKGQHMTHLTAAGGVWWWWRGGGWAMFLSICVHFLMLLLAVAAILVLVLVTILVFVLVTILVPCACDHPCPCACCHPCPCACCHPCPC